jgi:hypothetical protein
MADLNCLCEKRAAPFGLVEFLNQQARKLYGAISIVARVVYAAQQRQRFLEPIGGGKTKTSQ